MLKSKEGREPSIHPTVKYISKLLGKELGVAVYIIGARSLAIHKVDIGRETRDWDITIDKPFTPVLRDKITKILRSRGFKVQWRKWGFLVENDIHIDINYSPLIMDEEFKARSHRVADNLFLPSIEDIVVLKLISGERKDINDLKKILMQSWNRIDKEYLYKRVKQAGLLKELEKIIRRLHLR